MFLLEENLNARVSLESYSVSVLPTQIKIKGLQLAKRDKAAENQTPLADRQLPQPLIFGTQSFILNADLMPLTQGVLEINDIIIQKPQLDLVVFADGTNNLEKILQAPNASSKTAAQKKPTTSASSASKPSSSNADRTTSQATPNAKAEHKAEAEAGASTFVAKLGSLRLKQAEVDIFLKEPNLKIDLDPFDLTLNEIAVNPAQLESINQAELQLSGKLSLNNESAKQSNWAFLDFKGPATVQLFNPTTGVIDPIVHTDIKLKDTSHLSSEFPMLAKALSFINKQKVLNLDLPAIPDKATFSQSKTLALQLANNQLTIEKPIGLIYGNWEVFLHKASQLNLAKNTHQMSFTFIGDKQTSQRCREKLLQWAGKIKSSSTQQTVKDSVLKNLFNEQGLLSLTFTSSGPLETPKINLTTELPSLKNELKTQAKDLIKQQLKKDKAKELFKKLF